MFTVKFISFEEGKESSHSIQCPHYSSYQTDSGAWLIVVYKNMLTTDGVEWKVSKQHPRGFDVCFVENAAGKTVARFNAGD